MVELVVMDGYLDMIAQLTALLTVKHPMSQSGLLWSQCALHTCTYELA